MNWQKYAQRTDGPEAGEAATYDNVEYGDRLMLKNDHSKICCVTTKQITADGPNGCCKSREIYVSWAAGASADDHKICRHTQFYDSWGDPIPNSIGSFVEAVVHAGPQAG